MWEGQPAAQRKVALQLSERRLVRGVPRPLRESVSFKGIGVREWRAGWGSYARAWKALGADVSVCPPPGVPPIKHSDVTGLAAAGISYQCSSKVMVWCASFTQDLEEKEVGFGLEEVHRLKPVRGSLHHAVLFTFP